MSMTLTDVQARFKKFGKFINMANQTAPLVSQLKVLHAVTVDQTCETTAGVPNLSAEFDVNNAVVTVLGTSVNNVCTQINTIQTATLAASTTFLKTFVGPNDLGTVANPSNAVVGAALVAAMNAVGATVTPSGTNGVNASGIAMYFYNNFAITLPQSGSPTIPDTYITSTVL